MSSSTKPTLEKVPDAEDDLDDLDDVLDEFSPKAPPPTAAPLATSSSYVAPAPGRPRTNTRVDAKPSSTPGVGPPLDPTAEVDEDELSSEFAKELAKGMESLMKEITGDGSSPSQPRSPGGEGEADGLGDDEASKALKAAWEAMLIEGMNGKGGDELLPSLGELLGDKPPVAGASSSSSGTAVPENFQERIKQAMEKMKEGEDKLRGTPGAAPGPGEPGGDTIENLLKSLNDLGLGDGNENDTELAGFLESMMSQLMSKEILHEPLKELADNFPPYLANPPKPLSSEEKERYEKQLACVKKIIAVFEQPTYSDSDPQSNKQIVDLMSEMQSYGSPPAELMGDLPPGFADGSLPDPSNPENCIII